jgi:hypothetical protein
MAHTKHEALSPSPAVGESQPLPLLAHRFEQANGDEICVRFRLGRICPQLSCNRSLYISNYIYRPTRDTDTGIKAVARKPSYGIATG